MYLGQKNNFDVLCKCYGIDNSYCMFYGVLLDVEILVDVYFLMIGGQIKLKFVLLGGSEIDFIVIRRVQCKINKLKVIKVFVDELI